MLQGSKEPIYFACDTKFDISHSTFTIYLKSYFTALQAPL